MKIYTLTNCSYCVELKNLLKGDNIDFTEINIEAPEYINEFAEITKLAGEEVVPVIKLNNILLVPNKSFHTIYDGYKLIKKLLEEEPKTFNI